MSLKIAWIAAAAALALAGASLQAGDAKALYEKSCAACHGKEGKGDTAVGKKQKLKDYTDAKVQESLKDEDITKAIKEGVKEDGKVKMKAFDKLTDEEVKALLAYLRSLKK